MNLLDLLFPPRCVLCRRGVSGKARVCPACAAELRQQDKPCVREPIEGCMAADAAVVYQGKVRRALIDCKYQNRRAIGSWGGALVGACLMRHQPEWKADLVTYVPTTLGHWWKRGFNLSYLLAKAAARYSGLPCVRTVRRKWFGRSQLKVRTAKERRKNAEQTYFPGKPSSVSGKRVVLVDDILTSGATAAACVRILRQMGATEVFFICLAKTPDIRKK